MARFTNSVATLFIAVTVIITGALLVTTTVEALLVAVTVVVTGALGTARVIVVIVRRGRVGRCIRRITLFETTVCQNDRWITIRTGPFITFQAGTSSKDRDEDDDEHGEKEPATPLLHLTIDHSVPPTKRDPCKPTANWSPSASSSSQAAVGPSSALSPRGPSGRL